MTLLAERTQASITTLSEAPVLPKAPYNILAEQAVLGSVLLNNELFHRIGDKITVDHFYEPIHQRIYEAILQMIDKGLVASPVTLKNRFDADPALKDLQGAGYLVRLTGLVASTAHIESYALMVRDLYVKRQLIEVGQEIIHVAYDPQSKTGSQEQVEQAEQHLFRLAMHGAGDRGFVPLDASLREALDRAELAFQRSTSISGVSTGLTDLDRLLGGMQNSDLIILAGRPSMGKTALAVNMALNAVRALQNSTQDAKKPSVGFFSLEMSSEQLAGRMIAMVSQVNSSKLRTGNLSKEEFQRLVLASHQIRHLPFFIDDTPALSISALRTRARRLKRQHNLGALFVDYLQLVRGSSRIADTSRVLEISEITQGLKAIAKELNIPVVALSQLSRAVEAREDKRPQLSDLRESGTIEQDSDVVMFIYREEYYLSRLQPEEGTDKHTKWLELIERAHGKAEVIIAKQRHGPIGNVVIGFDADTTRFGDYDHPAYSTVPLD